MIVRRQSCQDSWRQLKPNQVHLTWTNRGELTGTPHFYQSTRKWNPVRVNFSEKWSHDHRNWEESFTRATTRGVGVCISSERPEEAAPAAAAALCRLRGAARRERWSYARHAWHAGGGGEGGERRRENSDPTGVKILGYKFKSCIDDCCLNVQCVTVWEISRNSLSIFTGAPENQTHCSLTEWWGSATWISAEPTNWP